MHIAFVTEDEALVQEWMSGKLRQGEQLHWHQRPEALFEGPPLEQYTHIVLSDRYFAFAEFSDFVDKLREAVPAANILVLLSDRHDANENGKWLKVCLVNGLRYVSPHRTRSAISNALLQWMYGSLAPTVSAGGKAVVFVGSTPNIGTTITSFGIAVGIANHSRQRVGYLCLNLKSSKLHRYIGVEKPETSLDQLRAEIRSHSLRPERLTTYCQTVKGVPSLSVLFGNQLREQAEFFTAEDIEHLIAVAKQTFDLCLIEVNAYWDNAATICALLQADSRILVTTPELTHFQEDTDRWLRALCPIIGLQSGSFDLVLTQADKGVHTAGIRQSDIRKETGLSFIGKVGKYPDLPEAVNQGRLLELLLGSHPVCRDLGAIVALLSAVNGFEAIHPPRAHPVKRLLGSVWPRRGKAGQSLWEG